MNTFATIAAVLLGLYVLGLVIALATSFGNNDPQRGVAQGCLIIVIVGLLAVGGVLYAAIHFQIRPLVYLVFALTVFPFVSLIGASIYYVIQRLRGVDM